MFTCTPLQNIYVDQSLKSQQHECFSLVSYVGTIGSYLFNQKCLFMLCIFYKCCYWLSCLEFFKPKRNSKPKLIKYPAK